MPVTIKMDSKEQEIERLEGRLKIAGGVCHEMKQPLMIISGHLELLLLKGQEDLELIDKINKVRHTNRCKSLGI